MCRVLSVLFLCAELLTSCAGCLAIWAEGPVGQNQQSPEQDRPESRPAQLPIESDSVYDNEAFIAQYAELMAQAASGEPEKLLARLAHSEQLVSHIQSVDSEPTISDSLTILRDAAQVYQAKLLVIANNLANADTNGFKRASLCIEACAYRGRPLPDQADAFDEHESNEVSVGTGVRAAGIRRDFSQGAFLNTGHPMDLAIVGVGFFQLTMIETGETVYSRAGNFSLDVRGQFVRGRYVLEPAITIPANSIDTNISESGRVTYTGPDASTPIEAGQIILVKFQNPNGLKACDGGCYRASDESGSPTVVPPGENGVGFLKAGYLEASNVSPLREYLDWAVTFRRWQHLLRMFQHRTTAEREVFELESHTNSTGMKFKLIPAGEFMMEASASDGSARDGEKPQQRVRIAKPFHSGVTEVTQGQWEAVMGTRPWDGQSFVENGKNHAATYVNWEDAVEFCRTLSEKEGVQYRLPPVAEWAYACRAGTTIGHHFGDDPSLGLAWDRIPRT